LTQCGRCGQSENVIFSQVASSFSSLAFLASNAVAGEIYTTFPSRIDPDGTYVFYSHGLIVEGDNPRPIHERWGVYDFPALKTALAQTGSFNLIAHRRPANTAVASYAEQLESWVRRLIEGGVQPGRITIVGFSRGGEITALASSELKPLPINTVLLAPCWERGVQDQPAITFSGRFLSIFETTDIALSCRDLAARSENLASFEEVEISTGKEHGAFFKPRSEWIDPLLRRIQKAPE
jgi:hypothetical protein